MICSYWRIINFGLVTVTLCQALMVFLYHHIYSLPITQPIVATCLLSCNMATTLGLDQHHFITYLLAGIIKSCTDGVQHSWAISLLYCTC